MKNAKDFITYLNEHYEDTKELTDMASIMGYAKEHDFHFTEEELNLALEAGGELPDSWMDAVSGGYDSDNIDIDEINAYLGRANRQKDKSSTHVLGREEVTML